MPDVRTIALIIPLRLTAGTYEGALRLRRICASVPRDLYEIVISDYGTLPGHAGPIEEMERDGIRVVRHPSPKRLFSIGQARDFGVKMAKSPVILFNDIDFLGTEATYRAIHAEVMRRDLTENRFDFFCVPVAFLTEAGSQAWLSAPDGEKPLAAARTVEEFETVTDLVQSVAYGSSAMVINRQHYLSLGGHDPRFTGHGAEDYDLLHRLAALAPKGVRPRKYYTDYGDNRARHYWGFRPLFALYGLDLAAQGLHLVHLWHPRRLEKGYFRPRSNFRLLRRIMKTFDRNGRHPPPIASAEDGEFWAVVFHDRGDFECLRQVLVLSGSFKPVKLPRIGGTGAVLDRLNTLRPDRVVIAPKAARSNLAIVSVLENAGFTVSVPEGEPVRIGARRGPTLFHYWQELQLVGLPAIRSGEIPGPRAADDPIFASFGGRPALESEKVKPPKRKPKSSYWVRFRRWLSGY